MVVKSQQVLIEILALDTRNN